MKNRRVFIFFLCSIFLCLWLFSCTRQQAEPVALTVSAAGMYRDVIKEVDKLYKQEKPNVTITYNIAGSGFLRKQIEQGVAVDIYISGLEKEMNVLQNQGLVIPETRQNITKNDIALIVPKDSILPISNFPGLTSQQVKRVALGSDKIAAGTYTKEVLTFLKIYEQVKKKAVFAEEDVRQIIKYVETKNVNVGITFLTEAKVSAQVKIVAVAPENSHTPVISPAAVLKNCKNVLEAEAFINFLKSDKAAPVFEKYGFTMIK